MAMLEVMEMGVDHRRFDKMIFKESMLKSADCIEIHIVLLGLEAKPWFRN